MFTSVVIKDVLDSMQQKLMEGGFELCLPYFFSRSLDFSTVLHKRVLAVRESERLANKKFWVAALCNRTPIKPYGDRRKRNKVGVKSIDGGTAHTFLYQSVTSTVNVRIFCSNLDYMETLEEWMCTRMIEESYKVNYTGFINDVEVLAFNIQYNGSDQLENKEFGAIGYIDISFDLSYPVLFDHQDHPVILEINYDLYTLSNSVLLEELQYREDLPGNPGKWKWFQGDDVI